MSSFEVWRVLAPLGVAAVLLARMEIRLRLRRRRNREKP
jgi:hypothetical protein